MLSQQIAPLKFASALFHTKTTSNATILRHKLFRVTTLILLDPRINTELASRLMAICSKYLFLLFSLSLLFQFLIFMFKTKNTLPVVKKDKTNSSTTMTNQNRNVITLANHSRLADTLAVINSKLDKAF